MIKSIYTKVASDAFVFVLPFVVSCSSLFGGGVSNNPAVAAQQQQVEVRKAELKEAERFAEEAEQREKATKDRVKAAEHELEALEPQAQAKRRGY